MDAGRKKAESCHGWQKPSRLCKLPRGIRARNEPGPGNSSAALSGKKHCSRQASFNLTEARRADLSDSPQGWSATGTGPAFARPAKASFERAFAGWRAKAINLGLWRHFFGLRSVSVCGLSFAVCGLTGFASKLAGARVVFRDRLYSKQEKAFPSLFLTFR
jgi:hypothetical protein